MICRFCMLFRRALRIIKIEFVLSFFFVCNNMSMFIRNFSLDKVARFFICIFISLVVWYVLSGTAYASYYEYYEYKLLPVLLFCCFLIKYYYGVKSNLFLKNQVDTEENQEPQRSSFWLVVVSAILVYSSIALLLYSAAQYDVPAARLLLLSDPSHSMQTLLR